MAAAREGHLASIAMLLAAGADTAQTDSDGRTALQQVGRANGDEARALLRLAPPTDARAAAWAALERRQAALDEAVEAAEAVAEAARRAALLAVEQGVRGSTLAARPLHRAVSRAVCCVGFHSPLGFVRAGAAQRRGQERRLGPDLRAFGSRLLGFVREQRRCAGECARFAALRQEPR